VQDGWLDALPRGGLRRRRQDRALRRPTPLSPARRRRGARERWMPSAPSMPTGSMTTCSIKPSTTSAMRPGGAGPRGCARASPGAGAGAQASRRRHRLHDLGAVRVLPPVAALHDHAAERGVLLFGDMPIFVAHDSAEVWARPRTSTSPTTAPCAPSPACRPTTSPPPGSAGATRLYRWDRLPPATTDFWIDRMRTQLRCSTSCASTTSAASRRSGRSPATRIPPSTAAGCRPAVMRCSRAWSRSSGACRWWRRTSASSPRGHALRRKYRMPGMKILQFAFGSGPENPYLPFHTWSRSVVYTGTHDNDTTLGWYQSLPDAGARRGGRLSGPAREPMPWPLIRAALGSRANLAILPMQDVLGLDGAHRMNVPGTPRATGPGASVGAGAAGAAGAPDAPGAGSTGGRRPTLTTAVAARGVAAPECRKRTRHRASWVGACWT
jgi:hypothetical protein